MEIIFELGVNPWLKEGTFSRRYPMQDGQPVKVEGDKVTWLKKKPEGGVLSAILDGGQGAEELAITFPLVGEMINEMVPYSLQFFLGITDEADELDEEIDEDDE